MNTRCLLITAVVGASLLTARGPSAAFGQCEITSVTATGVASGNRLGYSTGISGNYAVVGAYKADSNQGAAYIYERDGLAWNEIGKLVPEPALANGDEYGRAVAISGDVAVVAARERRVGDMVGRGAVYVFRRNQSTGAWEYEQELTAADGLEEDAFGSSVAIDGDWIVVGAPDNDEFGDLNSGTAYAYFYDGSVWMQSRKFRADDQAPGDKFANAVAISGNWVVVGTKADGDGCPGGPDAAASGSVYTFFHDPAAAPNAGWETRTKLQAQIVDGATVTCDADFSDNFGNSVAISGDRLVVGAVFNDDDGQSSGSAYVYRLEGPDWVIEQKLRASDGAPSNNFGRSVAIHGDLVLIGASKGDVDNPLTEDTGSAYLYRRSGTAWLDEVELTAGDAVLNDRFGWFVFIDGDYAIIGAYKHGGTGAAYVFAVGLASDCDGNGVHDDCDILSDPAGFDSNSNGVLDSCECATDADCVGALSCITGTCDSVTSLCVFTVDAGFCAIAGTCFNDGRINPANDCELCNPTAADSDWSHRDAGVSCGDLSDSTCDHTDTCDGEGLCQANPEPAGTVCADDGNECTDDQCDGAGTCSHPAVGDFTICTSDGNDCTDNRCQGGECLGFFLAIGHPCGDPTDSQCDPADTCDGAGTCLDNIKEDGTSCFDDGLFCTGEDSCQGGVCESAGDPCTAEGLICDEQAELMNDCSCDATVEGVCDDGLFCTGVEICDQGRCFSQGDPCVGQGLFCEESGCVECRDVTDCDDDGNECTVTVCRDGACEHDALADDTPCGSDLDDECTNPDTCVTGVCAANDEPEGTTCGDSSDQECDRADTCDGAGTCADNIPMDGTPCTDDGLFCNGVESCLLTVCVSEGDPCTSPGLICDAVAEQNDSCSCDGDAACDDGVFCNGMETCGATGSCEAGTDPCEAGEVCDEDNDICACDSNDDCAEDGLFCNGEEICVGGACVSAGDPCVSMATTPVCIEATDSCECSNNGHCDNGKYCDGAETCVNGACQDGADPCSVDEVCNEQSDVCEECETGDQEACNDGDSCTTDRCPFGICTHETLPECKDDDNDGVINSEDQCPDTPEDGQVDAIGCTCEDAIDTDHDGVIDCDDDCDDTPLGDSANSSGCSCSQLTLDSDGDGVADECDDCASTPSGESVDANGCGQSQIDSDGDGVMNDADSCSATPAGVVVGDDGCPPPVDNGNENDNTAVNDNDNGAGNTNDNGTNDNGTNDNGTNDNGTNDNGTNDNGSGNTNDNAVDNGNDNEPGQDIPVDGPAVRPCGLFGMINLVFLGLGMVAMRMTRRRHRRSRC